MIRFLILLAIRSYQRLISPLLPARCRFYPTCSNYALLCFQKMNLFRAFFLMIKRLLKCHPWHPGGYDPPSCCGDFNKKNYTHEAELHHHLL